MSLPVPARNDAAAGDAQANAAATAVAIQLQARASALETQTVSQKPTPAPTPANVSQPQQIVVQRGPIDVVTQFDGLIVSADQVPLAFSMAAAVTNVAVQSGQAVNAGDDLIDVDATQIQQSITDAQARLDTATARAQLAQAQLDTRQRDAQNKAQDALRIAQANLARVQAGTSDADHQAADAGLATAQNGLDKAQVDLDQLKAGASQADLRAADAKVASAQLAVRQAQGAKERLLAGPDQVAMQAAAIDLANAQDTLRTAQADLDALTQGPDPYALRAAQRELDRAQAEVTAAHDLTVGSSSGSTTQGQKNVAVKTAELGLQDAQDHLAQLKQSPKPEVLEAASTKVNQARRGVTAAQSKFDALKQAPDQMLVDKATGAVSDAQAALDAAESAAAALRAGPGQQVLQNATNAVRAAQMALQAAQTHRDDVYGHPTPDELKAAQQQLSDAKAEQARASTSAKTDPSTGDLLSQQNDIAQMRRQLDTLQASLQATRLLAPFDGVVVSVMVHPGDGVTTGKPVLIMSHPGKPVVAITLPVASATDSDSSTASPAARVHQGLPATVQIDGGDATLLNASVASVATAPDGGRRVGQLEVNWNGTPPSSGGTALVRIVVQHKDNVLLVPTSAVQNVGSARYVDTPNGDQHKTIAVQTGMVGANEVEITSGLSEGQKILSGLMISSSAASSSSGTPAATPTPGPANPIGVPVVPDGATPVTANGRI